MFPLSPNHIKTKETFLRKKGKRKRRTTSQNQGTHTKESSSFTLHAFFIFYSHVWGRFFVWDVSKCWKATLFLYPCNWGRFPRFEGRWMGKSNPHVWILSSSSTQKRKETPTYSPFLSYILKLSPFHSLDFGWVWFVKERIVIVIFDIIISC